MWCLIRRGCRDVTHMLENEYGKIIDYDTGEVRELPKIVEKPLWAEPMVWGYASHFYFNNAEYLRADYEFVKHIVSVENVQVHSGSYYSGYYIANGVVSGDTSRTLLDYLSVCNARGRVVYLRHRLGGFVKIEFDRDIGLDVTKGVLLRR